MQLSSEDILIAARIGASRRFLQDPAIGKDDAYQEACLMLLSSPQVDTIGLAAWTAKNRLRDYIKPAHSRHRLLQSELNDTPCYDRSGTPLEILEREELLDIIRTEPLTLTQRVIIDGMLDGHTPQELCASLSISLQSFSNMLSAAIGKLRKALGVTNAGSVRLGRCKRAKDVIDHNAINPVCRYCHAAFRGRKRGSLYCSPKCHDAANNTAKQQRKRCHSGRA